MRHGTTTDRHRRGWLGCSSLFDPQSVDHAIFDLDRTLAKGNTLVSLCVRCLRRRPTRLFALLFAALRAARTMVVRSDRHTAKQAVVEALLSGLSPVDAVNVGRLVAAKASCNPEVVEALKSLRSAGVKIWLASASVDVVVSGFQERFNVDGYVATVLEIDARGVTGRFKGPNCRGPEKLMALDRALPSGWAQRAVFFSDGAGDSPVEGVVAHAVRVRRGRLIGLV